MSASWPPSQAEIDRIKFLRQMEMNLKEQARRKEKEIAKLKEENALAKYILNTYESQKNNV